MKSTPLGRPRPHYAIGKDCALLNLNRSLLTCIIFACVASLQTSALAQRRVQVTQTFEPSFSIEPLVHRLEARAGDVLQFTFKVSAKNKDADISVGLVGLRQELSGQILHDESAVDATAIQLLNPGRYTIARDVPHIIEGVLKVPTGTANHYSYGVLVRDFGNRQDREPKFDASGRELTQAGINFITQYVLRIDLSVAGARGQNVKELIIDSGELAVANGLPGLSTLVRNPTDSTFEFEMHARLKRSPSDRSFKPVRMVMPSRQGVETEERFVARILPKSTIRMQELVPEPLVTSQYEMEVSLLSGGREYNQKSFSVEADSQDYPAQQAMIADVGGGIYASPARVELSQLRGGERRLAVELQNTSDEVQTLRIAAVNSRGTPIPGLSIQPAQLTLSPGRNRRLSVSLRRTTDFAEPIQYGRLMVTSTQTGQDFSHSGELAVAVVYGEVEDASLAAQPLRWVDGDKYPAFRSLVKNEGQKHMPLDARLLIVSQAGQRFDVPAGFGQWLMPGMQSDLEFRMPTALPPGNYQLTTEIQTGSSPLILRQDFTVSDFDNASTPPVQ